MVPSILNIHEKYLEELRKRLDSWDAQQRVGDCYCDVVSLLLATLHFIISLTRSSLSVFKTVRIRSLHRICEQLEQGERCYSIDQIDKTCLFEVSRSHGSRTQRQTFIGQFIDQNYSKVSKVSEIYLNSNFLI